MDFERMNLRIVSVGELPILGYPRNLKDYISWKMKEARAKRIINLLFA
jgi:hypothetical protein